MQLYAPDNAKDVCCISVKKGYVHFNPILGGNRHFVKPRGERVWVAHEAGN
jgi:hypothetical protein